MTKEDLIKFSNEIASRYKQGKIRAPIHLGGGNEDHLIEIFNKYKITQDDWILCTWRSHYHWLLSGRDSEKLKQQILDGHSMHIFDDKFFTSAIVGGIAPIAVGVAKALQLKNSKDRVFAFLGCMGANCGISVESIKYSLGHDLPVKFIIENNNLSVRTDTRNSWGKNYDHLQDLRKLSNVIYYEYTRLWPHAGTGERVLF